MELSVAMARIFKNFLTNVSVYMNLFLVLCAYHALQEFDFQRPDREGSFVFSIHKEALLFYSMEKEGKRSTVHDWEFDQSDCSIWR